MKNKQTSTFVGLAVSGLRVFAGALVAVELGRVLDDAVARLRADGVVDEHVGEGVGRVSLVWIVMHVVHVVGIN
jgi:hypothetical protein